MASIVPETILFPNGHRARAVYAPQETAIEPLITALHIPRPRGVLVVFGGTAQLNDDLSRCLRLLLEDGLARVAAEEQLTIVTGATDAGIFTLLGQGLVRWGGTAPCIGVTVANLVRWSNSSQADSEQAWLEPHHSHFVLTAGENWGDETATMYALIATLSAQAPSVAVLANGGAISQNEALANTRQGRPIIVLAGSGRLADEVSGIVRGERSPDRDELAEITRAGHINLFDLQQSPAQLADLVRQRLHLS